MSDVPITGGLGFIGTNLALRLLKQGHHVIAIDNLYCTSEDRIGVFRDFGDFEFLKHDVSDGFDDVRADLIFHLAAPASPVRYSKSPVYTIDTILNGTRNALECARANSARLVIASTSEIYGECQEHPQNESYNGNVHTMSVRASYDESKRCAETMAYCHHVEYGTNVVCARIFNTYGPYMQIDDGRVMTSFISSYLRSEPLRINGSGNQTRAFCYIDDLLDGLCALAHSGYRGIAVNLGNPKETSVLELAELFEEICGRKFDRVHEPAMEHEPVNRCPDISFAKKNLDFSPKIDLRTGIERTIRYFEGL